MLRWFLVVGLSGCSFTLSGPDPNRPRHKQPVCDEGKGLVGVDAVLAGGFLVGGIATANQSSAAILPLLLSAVFIGSAVHGNTVVNECRRANADYIASLGQPSFDEATDQAATVTAPGMTSPGMGPPPAMAPRAAAAPAMPPMRPRSSEPVAAPPVIAAPAPAPAQVPVAAPVRPAPRPPAVTQDPWRDFWREVH